MKLELFLMPKAESDIDEHFAYIARNNVDKARAFDQAVFSTFDRLCEAPFLGSGREYMNPNLYGLRMWFVKGFEKYLIFYRPFGNYIEIVRVLHSSQNRDLILSEDE